MRQTFLGGLGIALFLAAWEIVGRTGLLGISWPPLSDVLEMLADESRLPLFSRALGATRGQIRTQFLAEAGKLQLEIDPLTGSEIEGLLKTAYAAPKPIVARAAQLAK